MHSADPSATVRTALSPFAAHVVMFRSLRQAFLRGSPKRLDIQVPVVKVALSFREEHAPPQQLGHVVRAGIPSKPPLSSNSSACGAGLKSLTLPVWAELPDISILARVRPHLFHAFLHKECQRRGDLNLIIRVSAHDGLFSTTTFQKQSPYFGTCHVKIPQNSSETTPHSLGGSADWDDGLQVDAFKLCLALQRVFRTCCRRPLHLEPEQGALEEHWVSDRQLNALHVRARASAAQEAL